MELKKIYVVSRWGLFSLPPKIETRYIKRETEKRFPFVLTQTGAVGEILYGNPKCRCMINIFVTPTPTLLKNCKN